MSVPCCLLLPTVTPPGHYTSGGSTQICPDGSFRADWLPAQQATACTSCGSGVQGDKSDRLTVYNMTTGTTSLLPVMTTGGDCCELLTTAPAQHSTAQSRAGTAAGFGIQEQCRQLLHSPCTNSAPIQSAACQCMLCLLTWWSERPSDLRLDAIPVRRPSCLSCFLFCSHSAGPGAVLFVVESDVPCKEL